MFFWVWLNGALLGRVVAKDATTALSLAASKFGPTWDGEYEVAPRLSANQNERSTLSMVAA